MLISTRSPPSRHHLHNSDPPPTHTPQHSSHHIAQTPRSLPISTLPLSSPPHIASGTTIRISEAIRSLANLLMGLKDFCDCRAVSSQVWTLFFFTYKHVRPPPHIRILPLDSYGSDILRTSWHNPLLNLFWATYCPSTTPPRPAPPQPHYLLAVQSSHPFHTARAHRFTVIQKL